MGRVRTIARRSFLVGSVAIAGGVAFGAYRLIADPANPLTDDLGEGEAALTPWVKVTGAGITLITPHTDLGQGAYHMQAALIAEEMDLALGQFTVDPGPPAPPITTRPWVRRWPPSARATTASAPRPPAMSLPG